MMIAFCPIWFHWGGRMNYGFYFNDLISNEGVWYPNGTVGVQYFGEINRRMLRNGALVNATIQYTLAPLHLPAAPELHIGGQNSSDSSVLGRLYDVIIYRPRSATDPIFCGGNNDSSLWDTALTISCRCAPGFAGRPPSCVACGPNQSSLLSGIDRQCVCAAGYYGTPGNCVMCPINNYCPDNSSSPSSCPNGTTTASAGSKTFYECTTKMEWIPVGIFSTQLRISGYVGPMFRLRRSSDSALADLILGTITKLLN